MITVNGFFLDISNISKKDIQIFYFFYGENEELVE